MAALTGPSDGRVAEVTDRQSFPIANGITVQHGGWVGLLAGYVVPLADTVGLIPLGRIVGFGYGGANAGGAIPLSVTGNTSAAKPPEAIVKVSSEILRGVPVAGASTQADVDKLAYLGSDNWEADATLSATTNIGAIGRIVKRHSATSFDIRTFPRLES